MRRALAPTLALVLVAGAVAPVAVGQQTEPPDPDAPIGGLAFVDEYNLTVVNLIVHVTDGAGNPVTDLGRESFRVFQDGEEREITNFVPYTKEVYRSHYERTDLPPLAEPTPTASDAEPETAASEEEIDPRPIWLVLYVDHENLHPLDRNKVLSQMRTFVRENVQPPVQAMVISRQRTPKIVQEFTSDSGAVQQALRSMLKENAGVPSRERDRKNILQRIEKFVEDQSSNKGDRFRATALITGFAEEQVNDLSFTLSSLRETLTMLAGLPGKKAFLYISNGLPMVPAQDMYYAYANAYNDPSAVTQSVRYDQSRKFRSLVDLANSQGVTFYTVDAGGLTAAGIGTAEYARPQNTLAATIGQQNYQDSLMYMASGTGGLAILNTNDVSVHLPKIEADFYTYYSIGYPLAQSGRDKVHEVDVRLVGEGVGDYKVRHRKRFVEKSLESRVREQVQTALMFDITDNPMDLSIDTEQPAPATEDRWTVPMEVGFPIGNVALVPEEESYVGRVVVFIAARDTDGKQSDTVRQEHEIRIPAEEYEEALKSRYTLGVPMLMEGGSYRISVGMVDLVTRQASYASTRAIVGE